MKTLILSLLVILFSFNLFATETSQQDDKILMTYSYLKQARTMGELVYLLPNSSAKVELYRFIKTQRQLKAQIPDVKLLKNSLVFRINNKPEKITFLNNNQVLINGRSLTLADKVTIEDLYKSIKGLKIQKFSLLEIILSSTQAQVADAQSIPKVQSPLENLVASTLFVFATSTDSGAEGYTKNVNEALKQGGVFITRYQCTGKNTDNKGKLSSFSYNQNNRLFDVYLAYDESQNLSRISITDASCSADNESKRLSTQIAKRTYRPKTVAPNTIMECGDKCQLAIESDLAQIDDSWTKQTQGKDLEDPLPEPQNCSSIKYFASGERITSVQEENNITNVPPKSLKNGFPTQKFLFLDSFCQNPRLEEKMQSRVAENINELSIQPSGTKPEENNTTK